MMLAGNTSQGAAVYCSATIFHTVCEAYEFVMEKKTAESVAYCLSIVRNSLLLISMFVMYLICTNWVNRS